MYLLRNGSIKPGMAIGPFYLGMTYREVISISEDFRMESVGTIFEMIGENVRLSINATSQKVFHISVWGSFRGKVDGWLGIGTMWCSVIDRGLAYRQDDLSLFIIECYPNTYFELGEVHSEGIWHEADASILRLGISTDLGE